MVVTTASSCNERRWRFINLLPLCLINQDMEINYEKQFWMLLETNKSSNGKQQSENVDCHAGILQFTRV